MDTLSEPDMSGQRSSSIASIPVINPRNVHDSIDKHNLRRSLQPIIWCLKAFGGRVTGGAGRHYALTTYCVFCCCVNILGTCRLAFVFTEENKSGADILRKMMVFACYLQGALYGFISLASYKHILPFLAMFAAYRQRAYAKYKDKLFRSTRIFLTVTVVTVVGLLAVFLYFLFGLEMDAELQMWAAPWNDTPQVARISLLATLIFIIPAAGNWFMITLLFVIVCYIFNKELEDFNASVKRLAFKVNPSGDDFEGQRARHLALLKLMNKADDIFQAVLGVATVFVVFDICLIAYTLVTVQDLAFELFTILATMLVQVAHYGCLLTGAIWCNSLMQPPLGHIYEMRLGNLSDDARQELEFFRQQIQDVSSGISCSRLFLLDKSALTMICGTILTYAVIVFQFSDPDYSISPSEEPDVASTTAESVTSSWTYDTPTPTTSAP